MLQKVKHYSTLKMLDRIGFIKLIPDETEHFHYVDYDSDNAYGMSLILEYKHKYYTHRYFERRYVSGCFFPFVYEFKFHKDNIANIKHQEGRFVKNRCADDCYYLGKQSPVTHHSECSWIGEYTPWTHDGEPYRHSCCNQIVNFIKENI